jgi:hypothetical protein
VSVFARRGMMSSRQSAEISFCIPRPSKCSGSSSSLSWGDFGVCFLGRGD